MRPSLAVIFIFFTLLSVVLANPAHYFKRQDDADASKFLESLKPVKQIDERKPLPLSKNRLTAQAKHQSRTAVQPLSLSGKKVVASIQDGIAGANGGMFASLKTSVVENKEQASAVAAAPDTCKSQDNRKPWSAASKQERQAWMKAIRCTYNQPGTFHYKSIQSESLAHDFGYVHALMNLYLHGGSAFLPCHRALVLTWLDKLRNECGYTGDSLYLDLNTYADKGQMFQTKELWDLELLGSLDCPVKGTYVEDIHFRYIGTKNASSSNIYINQHDLCRTSSPFSNDGEALEPHLTSQAIKGLFAKTDFNNFRFNTETKLHNSFHAAIRRDMYASTSPFDAFLFFTYHLWIDCVYWVWQEKDDGKNRLKYNGLHRGTTEPVSINDQCPMLSLGTNWTVADVIDSREPPGCFNCKQFVPSPF